MIYSEEIQRLRALIEQHNHAYYVLNEPTDTFGRLITHFFPDNFLVGRMRVDNPEYRDGYFNVPKIGTEQRSTIRHTFD